MSEARDTTIGDVSVRITKGTTPSPAGFAASGVRFLKVESITSDGRIDVDKLSYIDHDTHEGLARSVLQPDDVLFTIAGSIGRVAIVDDRLLPANTNQAVAIIRPDRTAVEPRYLYYSLRDRDRLQAAASRIVQSVQANLSLGQLSGVHLRLPGLAEQRAIADVLGALDDKIAANAALAAIADQYLASLFEQLSRTAQRVTTLGSIAAVNDLTVRPLPSGHLRYLDIASVGDGTLAYPALSSWDEAPSRARRALRRGDTVWSTVRPNRRSHALNLADDPALVASTGLAVLTPKTVGFAYLYEVTNRPEFATYLENVAEGSAYPAVRAERFLDAPAPLASPLDIERFESIAAPIRESLFAASEESRTLAETRDALLPQLTSGKLSVRGAEALASAPGA